MSGHAFAKISGLRFSILAPRFIVLPRTDDHLDGWPEVEQAIVGYQPDSLDAKAILNRIDHEYGNQQAFLWKQNQEEEWIPKLPIFSWWGPSTGDGPFFSIIQDGPFFSAVIEDPDDISNYKKFPYLFRYRALFSGDYPYELRLTDQLGFEPGLFRNAKRLPIILPEGVLCGVSVINKNHIILVMSIEFDSYNNTTYVNSTGRLNFYYANLVEETTTLLKTVETQLVKTDVSRLYFGYNVRFSQDGTKASLLLEEPVYEEGELIAYHHLVRTWPITIEDDEENEGYYVVSIGESTDYLTGSAQAETNSNYVNTSITRTYSPHPIVPTLQYSSSVDYFTESGIKTISSCQFALAINYKNNLLNILYIQGSLENLQVNKIDALSSFDTSVGCTSSEGTSILSSSLETRVDVFIDTLSWSLNDQTFVDEKTQHDYNFVNEDSTNDTITVERRTDINVNNSGNYVSYDSFAVLYIDLINNFIVLRKKTEGYQFIQSTDQVSQLDDGLISSVPFYVSREKITQLRYGILHHLEFQGETTVLFDNFQETVLIENPSGTAPSNILDPVNNAIDSIADLYHVGTTPLPDVSSSTETVVSTSLDIIDARYFFSYAPAFGVACDARSQAWMMEFEELAVNDRWSRIISHAENLVGFDNRLLEFYEKNEISNTDTFVYYPIGLF